MLKRTLALLGALFAALASGAPLTADSRSTGLLVRVQVVRSCSVNTRVAGVDGGVALTCTRGSTPETGVASTSSGVDGRQGTQVVPVPAGQTTIVASRPAFLDAPPMANGANDATTSDTAPDDARAPRATRELVTLNF